MHELPPEELLSAYLDGEVTADEQVQAERLLAESADARRLFDELQALRGQFEGLPRRNLPDDFGRRVLRQAERAMLRPGNMSDGAADSDFDPEPTTEPSEEAVDETPFSERVRRPMLFAILAIATSLMLVYFNPRWRREDRHPRTVALSDSTGYAELDVAAPMSSRTPGAPVGGFGFSPLPNPDDQPVAEAKPGLGERLGRDGAENQDGRFDRPTIPAPIKMERENRDKDVKELYEKKGGSAGDASRLAGVSATQPPGLATATNDLSRGGLFIVKCEISPAVAESGAFHKLLARNQIAWRAIDPSLDSGIAAEGQAAPEAEKIAPAQQLDPMSRGLGEKARGKVSDMTYVETTPERLEAVMAEVRALPESYLSVEVAPSAGVRLQERWQTLFSRSRAARSPESAAYDLPASVANAPRQQSVEQQVEATQSKGTPAPTAAPAIAPVGQAVGGKAGPGAGDVAGGAAPAKGPRPAAATTPTQTATTSPPAPPAEKLSETQNLATPATPQRYSNNSQVGRARAYSIPADAFYEQGKSQSGQRNNEAGITQPTPDPAQRAGLNVQNAQQNAQQPGTLRALFVLQVATPEEAASAPAATAPQPPAKP